VAVADISVDRAQAVAREIDGLGVEHDVTNPESVAAAVAGTAEALGSIEIN
jgi:NAD(P)-dependent dehydrogenase (short-subunit alcohol dehydrogenase family)